MDVIRGPSAGAAASGPAHAATGPLEFWLFLPQTRMAFPTLVERARAAELAGFTGVALIDHMVPPGLPTASLYDPMTTAAVLAASTTYLKVTHLVLCAPYHHPAALAKQAVSLDHLSEGRYELGIGWGAGPSELRRFGFGAEPGTGRAARLVELLEVVQLLFTGEPVDHEGTYFRLQGAMQRPTPLHGRIPVTIGGAGPLTVPIAQRFADWWNIPSSDAERFEELVPQAGRARVSVQLPVGLARAGVDVEAVAALAERRFGHWGGLVTGTADDVVKSLAWYVERGARRFYLQFSDFGRPETLRCFSRGVVPALLEMGGGEAPEQAPRQT